MTATEIRERNIIKLDGKICQVVERTVSGTGKSAKSIHFKLKDVESGHTIERRFRTDEKVERVDVERRPMEFLYKDGENFVFMDQTSYEQLTISGKVVGHVAEFMKENVTIDVSFCEQKPVHIDFPKTIDMKVATAPPASGSGQDTNWKEIELENGVKVLAPQFIKEGDLVRVDVEQRKYVERLQEDN